MDIPPIDNLKAGQRISAREYNRRGRALQQVCRSLPSNSVTDSSGVHTRRVLFPASGGHTLHRAFLKLNASVDNTIDCYLDTDITGEVVEVEFDISRGGTAMNAVIARLIIGDPIVVWQDGATWRCIGTPFIPVRNCVCTPPSPP